MASLNVMRPADENEENRSGPYRRESPSVSQTLRRWRSSLMTAAAHVLVVILEAVGIVVNRI